MFIGICGGICAGKTSVADYLIKEHGFQSLYLSQKPTIAESPRPFSDKLILGENIFQSVDDLLAFVTSHWDQRWLLSGISDERVLEALLRRPFFLLLSVDAPVSVRWQRLKARFDKEGKPPPALEDFVLQNDEHQYNPSNGLAHLIDRAQVRLLNPSNCTVALHKSLKALDLTSAQRLRPSWDQYFMELASLAAQRSNCMKRRVGCVLVREKRVISTGYNGTPRNIRNCNEGGCPRCNGGQGAGVGLATCLCLHAEENALLEAGRERIREGSTLYCDTCPCLTCSVKITQVGITEVVYSQSYSVDEQTAAVFREAGVHFRQFSPPRQGLIDLGGNSMGVAQQK